MREDASIDILRGISDCCKNMPVPIEMGYGVSDCQATKPGQFDPYAIWNFWNPNSLRQVLSRIMTVLEMGAFWRQVAPFGQDMREFASPGISDGFSTPASHYILHTAEAMKVRVCDDTSRHLVLLYPSSLEGERFTCIGRLCMWTQFTH